MKVIIFIMFNQKHVSIFFKIPILLILFPRLSFADTADSEKTLTDALLYIIKGLNEIDSAIATIAVFFGVIIIGWALVQLANKHKNQQITYKGIAIRFLVGAILAGGIFGFLIDLSATVHEGDQMQKNVNSEFVGHDDNVTKCVKNNSGCNKY